MTCSLWDVRFCLILKFHLSKCNSSPRSDIRRIILTAVFPSYWSTSCRLKNNSIYHKSLRDFRRHTCNCIKHQLQKRKINPIKSFSISRETYIKCDRIGGTFSNRVLLTCHAWLLSNYINNFIQFLLTFHHGKTYASTKFKNGTIILRKWTLCEKCYDKSTVFWKVMELLNSPRI